jgi:hypothetical protein
MFKKDFKVFDCGILMFFLLEFYIYILYINVLEIIEKIAEKSLAEKFYVGGWWD